MNNADFNLNIIEAYIGLLKNLSPDNKLELISRLSDSMKTKRQIKDNSLESLYGAFISKQSAEELITDIKKSRTFKSKRAAL